MIIFEYIVIGQNGQAVYQLSMLISLIIHPITFMLLFNNMKELSKEKSHEKEHQLHQKLMDTIEAKEYGRKLKFMLDNEKRLDENKMNSDLKVGILEMLE